ncbi:MAG TPA: TlpA disulfide reductase family protein [Rhodanobacteraceae bacterium]|nr:TlpA disulfide reductase family protein [Rhodanobacteraceae bacterium]
MPRMPRLAISACVLLATWMMAPVAVAQNTLRIGAPAPSIVLVTLDGKRIDTRDLRGDVVILTFWATWCTPCREELPLLSRYARQHAQQKLVVLGFSLDTPDQLDKVRAVAAALNFPNGVLDDPHVPGYGRIWHLPVNFVIDRQGRLAYDGWKDPDPVWTRARLEEVVTPLLDAQR